MEEQNVPPMKQRITFYAPKTVIDIIDLVKKERADGSITDAICQIILEYGSQRQFNKIENLIDEKFGSTLQEIERLKAENEALGDRLTLVETKCASVNRAVSEMQTTYIKE